ncbi:hypothetical protein HWV62_27145 [Athelia sp. TMB]|nr:hypothetical protein HWV62_27145 [Athelia sp. TMB]
MSAAPQLDAPLPTPATEWADGTQKALEPLAPVPPAPAPPSALLTPGPALPGAYPFENPSIYPQANEGKPENTAGAKAALHDTATAYIAPERLDQVEHLVEGVGSTAAKYVPAGVASAVSSYWCEWKPSKSLPPVVAAVDRRAQRSMAWRAVGWAIVLVLWFLRSDGSRKPSPPPTEKTPATTSNAVPSSSKPPSNSSSNSKTSWPRPGSYSPLGLGRRATVGSWSGSTPASASRSPPTASPRVPRRPPLGARRSSLSSMLVLSSLVLAPAAATAYTLSGSGGGGSGVGVFGGLAGRLRGLGFGAALTLFYSAFALTDARENDHDEDEEADGRSVAVPATGVKDEKEKEKEAVDASRDLLASVPEPVAAAAQATPAPPAPAKEEPQPTPAPVEEPQPAPKVMEAPAPDSGHAVAAADLVDPSTPAPPVLLAPAPAAEPEPKPAPTLAPAPAHQLLDEAQTPVVEGYHVVGPSEARESRDAAKEEKANGDGKEKEGEKKEGEKALGMAGVGAGVAAFAASQEKGGDEKQDKGTGKAAVASPTVVLTARRYAMGSAPPAPEEPAQEPNTTATHTTAQKSGDDTLGAKGAWDVPENANSASARTGKGAGVEKAPASPAEAQRAHGGEAGRGDGEESGADMLADLQGLALKGGHADAEKTQEAPAPAAEKTPEAEKTQETPAPAPAAEKKATPPSTPRKAGDPGYHPALLHPMTPPATPAATFSTPTPDVGKGRPTSPFGSIGKKSGHQRAPSMNSTASGKKKVGFFDKVRGEAKIVMGKIEHKKEKVEAGKRILHGED